MLSKPECIEFAKTILDQLSGGKGGSLKDVSNAFFDQPKPHDLFTRAMPDGSVGEATALGRLKDSTATVFLSTQGSSQTWGDADNLVQELFHFARPGGGIYSDEQLARALRKTRYVTDETKAFPDGTANIFDKRYNPGSPKPWSKATGYRALTPLHSDRKDVEALLGSPARDWGTSATYETDHEGIVAKYSDGGCDATSADWNVPKALSSS
jgi:hypothetical protein